MTDEYTTEGIIKAAVDVIRSQTKLIWTAGKLEDLLPKILKNEKLLIEIKQMIERTPMYSRDNLLVNEILEKLKGV